MSGGWASKKMLILVLHNSLNMTFGWELVEFALLHVGKSSMHSSEVVWRLEQRKFYVETLKVRLILICHPSAKLSLALNEPIPNQYSFLFIQFRIHPPSMHHQKWKEIIKIACKTTTGRSQGTHQIPKKSPVKVKENSNELNLAFHLKRVIANDVVIWISFLHVLEVCPW